VLLRSLLLRDIYGVPVEKLDAISHGNPGCVLS
jgi:hypothetical protein